MNFFVLLYFDRLGVKSSEVLQHCISNSIFPSAWNIPCPNCQSCVSVNSVATHAQTPMCHPVAYRGIFGGQRERESGGSSPLVRCSGGICNLVQEISFHIVKFS
jgi:hypothetical protein